jgi:hypothetical protein
MEDDTEETGDKGERKREEWKMEEWKMGERQKNI